MRKCVRLLRVVHKAQEVRPQQADFVTLLPSIFRLVTLPRAFGQRKIPRLVDVEQRVLHEERRVEDIELLALDDSAVELPEHVENLLVDPRWQVEQGPVLFIRVVLQEVDAVLKPDLRSALCRTRRLRSPRRGIFSCMLSISLPYHWEQRRRSTNQQARDATLRDIQSDSVHTESLKKYGAHNT